MSDRLCRCLPGNPAASLAVLWPSHKLRILIARTAALLHRRYDAYLPHGVCWSQLCDDLEVVDVPGDHFALLRQSVPDMSIVVHHLKSRLGAFGWAEAIRRDVGGGQPFVVPATEVRACSCAWERTAGHTCTALPTCACARFSHTGMQPA